LSSFKIQEKIEKGVIVEKVITPYIKIIYPTGKWIYLTIPNVKNFPKVGNKFNSVYNYEEIKVEGIDETGLLYGYIKLGYSLKQITHEKKE
jgi:hypothetical protein